MKGQKIIFFLIFILASNISLAFGATNEGYGEDSTALGQFVDSYENSDNVSVTYQVINNLTLECMELEYPPPYDVIFNLTNLREHDLWANQATFTYSIASNDQLRITSTVGGYGTGWVFFVVNSAWLDDKYIRFRWYPTASSGSSSYWNHWFEVYDGTYDRSSDVDFPSGSPILLKGNGLLYSYKNLNGINNWYTKDFQIDTSGGSETNVTVFFRAQDSWGAVSVSLYLDWIEVNEGAGGTGNIVTINFNNSSPITMERTATAKDYGFALSPELPYQVSGYETNGYFTSTDYLSSPLVNGSAIVHMSNTSIPSGTGITIEFSDDNSTWVLNDWEPLFGGFESIDLRELNYSTGYYTRQNMTGTGADTPRVYQSRLITTIGNKTTDILIQNITGEWEYHNLTAISTLVGTLDSGNLASTLDIDGNGYNVSETVGNPAFIISYNWTNVNEDAGCLWVVMNVFYDGNQAHDIHVELYNFTSTSWIEIKIIEDGIDYEWVNSSIYDLRIPNDFVNSSGAVLGRIIHDEAGNINHDISIEYLKLHAFIPSGVSITGGINSATILMLIFLCSIGVFILVKGVRK